MKEPTPEEMEKMRQDAEAYLAKRKKYNKHGLGLVSNKQIIADFLKSTGKNIDLDGHFENGLEIEISFSYHGHFFLFTAKEYSGRLLYEMVSIPIKQTLTNHIKQCLQNLSNDSNC